MPYLTPSYGAKDYISMGGAGYIYPESRLCKGCSYGEGDTVEVRINFDRKTVSFSVVGSSQEASVPWSFGDEAFMAFSSEGGPVNAIVSFM